MKSSYYAQRKAGTIDAYPQNWSADFNDPDNFFYTFFSKSGSTVRGLQQLSDQAVFDDVEKARSMTDPEARCEILPGPGRADRENRCRLGADVQPRPRLCRAATGEELRGAVERLERHELLQDRRRITLQAFGRRRAPPPEGAPPECR